MEVEKLSLCIVLPSLLVVNVIGNSLVVFVILKVKRLRGPSTSMLFFLALLDLSFGVTIFLSGGDCFYPGLDIWWKIVSFCFRGCGNTFTLVVIAIERYIAVMKPFYHKVHISKKWAYKAIAIIMFLMVLLSIPFYIFEAKENQSHVMQDLQLGYGLVLICICTVLPALLMSFLYGRIIYRVWLRPNTQGTNTAIMKTRRKLTTILLTVTVVFYLCWLPLLLFMSDKISYEIKSWLVVFPLLNTVLNPIIYTLHSPSFRQGIKTLCCGCCATRKVRAGNTDLVAAAQRRTTICCRINVRRNHRLNQTCDGNTSGDTNVVCLSVVGIQHH